MATQKIRITVYNGGHFNDTMSVKSKTVGQLRNELNISASASIAVNTQNASDSFELRDKDIVAYVEENKSGGC